MEACVNLLCKHSIKISFQVLQNITLEREVEIWGFYSDSTDFSTFYSEDFYSDCCSGVLSVVVSACEYSFLSYLSTT